MSITNSANLLTGLRTIVGPDHLHTDSANALHYGRDWTHFFTPAPLAVALPGTVAQVQQLIQYANAHHLAVVPSGGRTGLSGGAVAANGELVLSFERLNRILAFDPLDRSVTCEPGVITETLQQYAREQGLFYPIDFAARGSSQIGGNIATNAGGIKVLRYGLTRDWVTGLKVITGSGELLDLNKGLVKNASGYDLRHLFIGSEGTLGCIVEATVKLTLPPYEPSVMVLGVAELADIMAIFQHCRQHLPLTAFEFFSAAALDHVLQKGLQPPFDTTTAYYLLIEFENTTPTVQDSALAVFEYGLQQGWLQDGVISQNQTQAQELWRLREDITESLAQYLPYKNDISVRIAQVPAFLQEIDQLLADAYPDFEVIWFGHIGDGNLHISVLKPTDLELPAFVARCQHVNELLFGTLQRYGGSISAEHGVGLTKKPYLHYTRTPAEITYMRAMKRVFDPNSVLNPGKIFD